MPSPAEVLRCPPERAQAALTRLQERLRRSMNRPTPEEKTVLTIAALSNTGPLAGIAESVPISYATLNDAAKWILTASMVLGRLETLVIIALLNPEFWRN